MCKNRLTQVLLFFLIFTTGTSFIEAKVLKCTQIDILNLAFQNMPFALARLRISHKAVIAYINNQEDSQKQIIEKSSLTEAQVIKKQLDAMLIPIKDFLAEIRKSAYFVKPLIEKSLSKTSYLIRFMESDGGLMEFFEHEITSKNKLNDLCNEFQTFLKDIEDSLTDETRRVYKEFINEVKQAKQSQPSCRGMFGEQNFIQEDIDQQLTCESQG